MRPTNLMTFIEGTQSRKQFECLREARTDANRAEVPAIRCQHTVDVPALSDCRNRSVNEADIEILELGIEFQRHTGAALCWQRQIGSGDHDFIKVTNHRAARHGTSSG